MTRLDQAAAKPSAAPDELATLDATGLAAAIRARRLSSTEALDAAIARIEALNPRINAVVRKRYEQARTELAEVAPDAHFAGVPMLIKDVVIAGEPFYNGNKAMAAADMRASATDVFVTRMRKAGCVVMGETNIPEFTSMPTTESRLHGPCRNPWDLDRSVGGSSGGAAAAVASLMVQVAQSSDGGGSSRIPASANGLFTIKTSRGRTPLGPNSAGWLDITSSKSFVTRSVRDFAGLLDALGGPDLTETMVAPRHEGSYSAELGKSSAKLRIGMCQQIPGGFAMLDADAMAAVRQSAQLLSDLGHHVEEAAPETFTSAEAFSIMRSYWPIKLAMRVSAIEEQLKRPLTADDVEPSSYQLIEYARSHSMADLARSLQRIRDFTNRSLAWWGSHDLLLTPTTGSLPPKLGALTETVSKQGQEAALRWAGLCSFANITGQPAASVPLYWSEQGLPIGTHLVANIGKEAMLLRLAAQLERAKPWIERLPILHG